MQSKLNFYRILIWNSKFVLKPSLLGYCFCCFSDRKSISKLSFRLINIFFTYYIELVPCSALTSLVNGFTLWHVFVDLSNLACLLNCHVDVISSSSSWYCNFLSFRNFCCRSVLKIKGARDPDVGIYTCTVVNQYGSLSFDFHVKLTGLCHTKMFCLERIFEIWLQFVLKNYLVP